MGQQTHRSVTLIALFGLATAIFISPANAQNGHQFAPLLTPLNPPSTREVSDWTSRLKREKAQTGEIQISLFWNNLNDLDLYVSTPCGTVVGPSGPDAALPSYVRTCGGELDVDANVTCSPISLCPGRMDPVENIFWHKRKAPEGNYKIYVHHFSNHGSRDPTKFTIRLVVGEQTEFFRGQLSAGAPTMQVHEFRNVKE